MKYEIESGVNYYLEAIALLERVFFESDDEEEIIKRFIEYGISDVDIKQLFIKYQSFKQAIINDVNQEKINEFQKYKIFFKQIPNNNSLIYQFSAYLKSYYFYNEQNFYEALYYFIYNLYIDFSGEQISTPKTLPNMPTTIQLINQLTIENDIKLLLIDFYTLSYFQYLELVVFIEEVSKIVEKYFPLIENEITLFRKELLNETNLKERLSSALPKTNVNELMIDNIILRVSIFKYNSLSIIILDDSYYEMFHDELVKPLIIMGYLFFPLLNLKTKKYQEHLKLINAFKCLSDPTRFKIIQLLHEAKRYPQELARMLNLSPATLNHHLDVLKSADLVDVMLKLVDEKRVYYALNYHQIAWINTFFNELLKGENNGSKK